MLEKEVKILNYSSAFEKNIHNTQMAQTKNTI